jgi:hypothetical protein
MKVDQKGYYTGWSWMKTDVTLFPHEGLGWTVEENGLTFFLTKVRDLTADENSYDNGPKRILYRLVVDENGCDPFSSRRVGVDSGRKWIDLFPHKG